MKKEKISGRSISSEEMRSIKSYPDIHSDSPCEKVLECHNGKTLRCSTDVPGEKCYTLMVGINDVEVAVGIICGSKPQYCKEPDEGGSGSGTLPEVPDPDPEPVIPPSGGSGA